MLICAIASCTCAEESHPGPARANGSYVGRGAPEIDVFEALVDRVGKVRFHIRFYTLKFTNDSLIKVSQSGQWAPFNVSQYYHVSEIIT